MPPGTNPDIVKLAKATQDPALGNSSVHLAMNAMLSKASMGAFIQTAKMEAMEMVSDKIKEKIGGEIGERFSALMKVNDKITVLQEIADKESEPLFKSVAKNKIEELQKIIEPIKQIPEVIMNVVSVYNNLTDIYKN